MNNEIDIVFALLRAALNGSEERSATLSLCHSATLSLCHSATQSLSHSVTQSLSTHEWWRLFRLMQQNHVAALTADTIATLDVPREVKIPWLAESDKAARWYRYQTEVQDEIVGTMQKHGIETLVLKGTHTAQYYPKPELREFGDLDLYFYRDRGLAPVAEEKRMGQVPVPCHDVTDVGQVPVPCHDIADSIAREEMRVTITNDVHHHSKYNYRGVTVESHYDFFNRYYPGSNRQYNQMLMSLVPSPTFEVLHFLRHAAIHFAAQGLNLRDLCDWSLLVTHASEADWDVVRTEIERFGMGTFVAALDGVTRARLGVASPLHLDISDDMVRRLEDDILHGRPNKEGYRKYFHSHWKRQMAFGDTPISLMIHKIISYLSHKTKHPAS